jgi:hypothetical protein
MQGRHVYQPTLFSDLPPYNASTFKLVSITVIRQSFLAWSLNRVKNRVN